ncbi:hypothetical protein BJ170DRAFT_712258 [Xylariales sp. AK1849]|nr:hypothetical protein BJ170DRAFT_712258 [Xylariales sp. AK1849]
MKELADVKEELEEKTEECTQLRSAWQDALDEAENLKSTDRSFTMDDDTVGSKWKSLKYAIRNLTAQYFNQAVAQGQLTQYSKNYFAKLTPFYMEFLNIENHPQYIFQAYIWQFLLENVLSSPLKVCGTKISDPTGLLLRYFKDKSHSEQQKMAMEAWRAETGQLVHDLHGVKDDFAERIVTMLGWRVNSLVSRWNHAPIKTSMRDIVAKAVELAVIFGKFKQIYLCRMSAKAEDGKMMSSDFEYERQWMDAVCATQNRKEVILMISPALIKYGNSKGENYEQSLILDKAGVYCN